MRRQTNFLLFVIVLCQFLCTSLWFAGNGVMPELIDFFQLEESALGHLTSAVQFGFIVGTLIFAILQFADRFSPSMVFLICGILGASANGALILPGNGLTELLTFRFLTGFFLAGIYPVGMKIASDHFEKGLGVSLGFLVGALVLGTAFPHLLRDLFADLEWTFILLFISALSVMGGLLMWLLVPDGPFRKGSTGIVWSSFYQVFRKAEFRRAAFGYFGHMWELYAFWTFVPIIIATYMQMHDLTSSGVSLLSFIVIGIGALGCITGGFLSVQYGPGKVAFISLLVSGTVCVLSPILFYLGSPILAYTILLIWGLTVIADSPLFSTLVARTSEARVRGTALTIVNSVGFAISVVSIQLLTLLLDVIEPVWLYLFLAPGPILGLSYILYSRRNILQDS